MRNIRLDLPADLKELGLTLDENLHSEAVGSTEDIEGLIAGVSGYRRGVWLQLEWRSNWESGLIEGLWVERKIMQVSATTRGTIGHSIARNQTVVNTEYLTMADMCM